jgi:nitronate monooxygenase
MIGFTVQRNESKVQSPYWLRLKQNKTIWRQVGWLWYFGRMVYQTAFTLMTGVRLPVIMAPMFLVSNQSMIEAALLNGVMGVFPSLNFRNEKELDKLLAHLNEFRSIHAASGGSFGANLIVQKTNVYFKKHLELCVRHRVPFYITSLGNPAPVIEAAHGYGAKVFCDVTTLEHAEKANSAGCDGFIAVGQGAGGHAGNHTLLVLVPALKKRFPDKPVIAAGGIVTGGALIAMLALGADGVSIGTRFIASSEATVSHEYKQAILQAGMEDIVLTEKLSGTPCSIINTPYARKIGYRQNLIERMLSRHPQTKRWFKQIIQLRGLRLLEKAIRPGSYQNLWCAGQSVGLIDEILSCQEIIQRIEKEAMEAYGGLKGQIQQ